jgi:hypothetical protein
MDIGSICWITSVRGWPPAGCGKRLNAGKSSGAGIAFTAARHRVTVPLMKGKDSMAVGIY